MTIDSKVFEIEVTRAFLYVRIGRRDWFLGKL